MFIFARTIVYATLFIGFLLLLLPMQLVERAGFAVPTSIGPLQLLGGALTIAGATLAVGCILTFVIVGKGTPAPFDPPRQLVARGPYRFVRNPMYEGAFAALLGAALYYRSSALTLYAMVFLLASYAFVKLYEEPALRRRFGDAYADYCRRVGGWLPGRHR